MQQCSDLVTLNLIMYMHNANEAFLVTVTLMWQSLVFIMCFFCMKLMQESSQIFYHHPVIHFLTSSFIAVKSVHVVFFVLFALSSFAMNSVHIAIFLKTFFLYPALQ